MLVINQIKMPIKAHNRRLQIKDFLSMPSSSLAITTLIEIIMSQTAIEEHKLID
jgi:hypothetical protein